MERLLQSATGWVRDYDLFAAVAATSDKPEKMSLSQVAYWASHHPSVQQIGTTKRQQFYWSRADAQTPWSGTIVQLPRVNQPEEFQLRKPLPGGATQHGWCVPLAMTGVTGLPYEPIEEELFKVRAARGTKTKKRKRGGIGGVHHHEMTAAMQNLGWEVERSNDGYREFKRLVERTPTRGTCFYCDGIDRRLGACCKKCADCCVHLQETRESYTTETSMTIGYWIRHCYKDWPQDRPLIVANTAHAIVILRGRVYDWKHPSGTPVCCAAYSKGRIRWVYLFRRVQAAQVAATNPTAE